MLLFAVAMQASLQRANGAADGATIVTSADNVAGRVDAYAPRCTALWATRHLCGWSPPAAAQVHSRCWPRFVCTTAGAALAAELGARRQPEGTTLTGMWFGSQAHTENMVGARAADTVKRVDKLLSLPLRIQFSLLLLRLSPSRRMLHPQRSVP